MKKHLNHVCILGAGTMGTKIGVQAAISGFRVIIYDHEPNAFIKAESQITKIIKQFENQENRKQVCAEAISRISFTNNPIIAVQNADIISENVTESLSVKEKVWDEFGKITPDKTIFTTNTSFLLPSVLAPHSGRPEKFCAFHFHDVFYSKVVDVMPHPGTDPLVIPILFDFGRKLEQIPVLVKKENPGYLFNNMLLSFIGTAGNLLVREIGSLEDIDKSWMVNFHMPMGPFGILDSVGLDTAWHITKEKKDLSSQRFAQLLKKYVDEGKLGEKSGEGFYKYPKPRYKDPDFLLS